MKQADDQVIERLLRRSASQFPYPPTPDVHAHVRAAIRSRRPTPRQPVSLPRPPLRLAPLSLALAVLLLLASLLLVPQVRASVRQLLRAGGITIFITDPTPTATAPGIRNPAPAAISPATATPAAPATAAAPPSGEPGQAGLLVPATPISLAQAVEALQVATLPSSLPPFGAPQGIYVDDESAATVAILLWDLKDGRQIVLYAIGGTDFAYKMADEVVTATVRGSQAFWVDGLHRFILRDGDFLTWETVRGSVLIWTEGDLTYRLEGAASLEEARTLAESLE
jgi:hypothetical protein